MKTTNTSIKKRIRIRNQISVTGKRKRMKKKKNYNSKREDSGEEDQGEDERNVIL